MNSNEIGVFLGLDVGKTEHWAHGLTPDGVSVWDQGLPTDEAELREVILSLSTYGPVLVVVDQPASIGALAVSVAQSMGVEVAYLPGLAMRRIADLYPGNAKTDARDAYVIADAARTMPHTLRSLKVGDESEASLAMLTGFDQDLTRQSIKRATGSVAYIPRSTHLWRKCWALTWTTWPSLQSLKPGPSLMIFERPGAGASTPSSPSTALGATWLGPKTSSTHWPSKQSL